MESIEIGFGGDNQWENMCYIWLEQENDIAE